MNGEEIEIQAAQARWLVEECERLRAQLAEAQRERDQYKVATAYFNKKMLERGVDIENLSGELAAAKARADRLEAAIRKADHDDGCSSLDCVLCDADEYADHEGPCHKPKPCNCWKREALEGK